MKKFYKNAYAVTIVSLILALIVALIFYFYPEKDDSVAFKVSAILAPIWTFGLVPSFIVLFRWLRRRSLREKLWMGFIFQWLLFLLPIAFSPFMAVAYYILYINRRL